jgi:hypothetical protein
VRSGHRELLEVLHLPIPDVAVALVDEVDGRSLADASIRAAGEARRNRRSRGAARATDGRAMMSAATGAVVTALSTSGRRCIAAPWEISPKGRFGSRGSRAQGVWTASVAIRSGSASMSM